MLPSLLARKAAVLEFDRATLGRSARPQYSLTPPRKPISRWRLENKKTRFWFQGGGKIFFEGAAWDVGPFTCNGVNRLSRDGRYWHSADLGDPRRAALRKAVIRAKSAFCVRSRHSTQYRGFREVEKAVETDGRAPEGREVVSAHIQILQRAKWLRAGTGHDQCPSLVPGPMRRPAL